MGSLPQPDPGCCKSQCLSGMFLCVCWTGTEPTHGVHKKGGATTPCAFLLSLFLEIIDVAANKQ